MNAIPLVRVNAFSPVMRFLHQVGAPAQKFLIQTKLPMSVLDKPEALISLYQGCSFVELAARREGIELLGVLANQQAKIADLGLFGKILSQSLTGYDLLQTIVALLTTTYSSGARVWLTQDSDRIWFNHRYAIPAHLVSPQCQYYACLMHLRVIQKIVGSGWHPTDLHFHSPKIQGLAELEWLSATKVCFDRPHNAIGLSKSLLHVPIPRWNISDRAKSQDYYERLRSSAPAVDFTESLQQFVRLQLPSGYIQREIAAEAAGISVRTLQRRLAEEGLSYSQLVNQVRLKLATELLLDPTLQLVDIAFELGYTRPGTFTRAFQSWTGRTPSTFRRLPPPQLQQWMR